VPYRVIQHTFEHLDAIGVAAKIAAAPAALSVAQVAMELPPWLKTGGPVGAVLITGYFLVTRLDRVVDKIREESDATRVEREAVYRDQIERIEQSYHSTLERLLAEHADERRHYSERLEQRYQSAMEIFSRHLAAAPAPERSAAGDAGASTENGS